MAERGARFAAELSDADVPELAEHGYKWIVVWLVPEWPRHASYENITRTKSSPDRRVYHPSKTETEASLPPFLNMRQLDSYPSRPAACASRV